MGTSSLATGVKYPTEYSSVGGSAQLYRNFVEVPKAYALIYNKADGPTATPNIGKLIDPTSPTYFYDIKEKGVQFSTEFDYLAVNTIVAGTTTLTPKTALVKAYNTQTTGYVEDIGVESNNVLVTGVTEYQISTHSLGYVPAVLSRDTSDNSSFTSFKMYKVSDNTFRYILFSVDATNIVLKEYWQTFETSLPSLDIGYEFVLLDQGLDSSGLASASDVIQLSPTEVNLGDKIKSDRDYLRIATERDYPYPLFRGDIYTTNTADKVYESIAHCITDDYYFSLEGGVVTRYSFSFTSSSISHTLIDSYDLDVSDGSLITISSDGLFLYVWDNISQHILQYHLGAAYSLSSPTLVFSQELKGTTLYTFQTLDIYKNDTVLFFGGANGGDGIMELSFVYPNTLPSGTTTDLSVSASAYSDPRIKDNSYFTKTSVRVSDEFSGNTTYPQSSHGLVGMCNSSTGTDYVAPVIMAIQNDWTLQCELDYTNIIEVPSEVYLNSLDIARDKYVGCVVATAVDGASNNVNALHILRLDMSLGTWTTTILLDDGVNFNPDSRMSVDGNRVAVSADNGTIYVYDWDGVLWVKSVITHSDLTTYGVLSFGFSGDTLAVSLDSGQETLLLFSYSSSWSLTQTISKPEVDVNVEFGSQIVVSKDENKLFVLNEGVMYSAPYRYVRCTLHTYYLSAGNWVFSRSKQLPEETTWYAHEDDLVSYLSTSVHNNDIVYFKQKRRAQNNYFYSLHDTSGGWENLFYWKKVESDQPTGLGHDGNFTRRYRITEGLHIESYGKVYTPSYYEYVAGSRALSIAYNYYEAGYGARYHPAVLDSDSYIEEGIVYPEGVFQDTPAGQNLLAIVDDGYTMYTQGDGNTAPGFEAVPYGAFYTQMKMPQPYELVGGVPEESDLGINIPELASVETMKFLNNNTQFVYTKRDDSGIFLGNTSLVGKHGYTEKYLVPQRQFLQSFAWSSTTYDPDVQVSLGFITSRVEDGSSVYSIDNRPYDYVNQDHYPTFPGLDSPAITCWPDLSEYSAEGYVIKLVK